MNNELIIKRELKFTRINPTTWITETCSLREKLEDCELYEHTDLGRFEMLESILPQMKEVTLNIVDFLELKYGDEFTKRFMK
jgi:hypothetical protein